MFLLHGRDWSGPSADPERLFILTRALLDRTDWRGEGEKLRLVSFVPELQRGSRSLPRRFQLAARIYQHANLHIRHGSHCLAPRQVVEEDEEEEEQGGEGGDGSHEGARFRGDERRVTPGVKGTDGMWLSTFWGTCTLHEYFHFRQRHISITLHFEGKSNVLLCNIYVINFS